MLLYTGLTESWIFWNWQKPSLFYYTLLKLSFSSTKASEINMSVVSFLGNTIFFEYNMSKLWNAWHFISMFQHFLSDWITCRFRIKMSICPLNCLLVAAHLKLQIIEHLHICFSPLNFLLTFDPACNVWLSYFFY